MKQMRQEVAGLAAVRRHTAGVVGNVCMKVSAPAFGVATLGARESSLRLHCWSPFRRRYYEQLSSLCDLFLEVTCSMGCQ